MPLKLRHATRVMVLGALAPAVVSCGTFYTPSGSNIRPEDIAKSEVDAAGVQYTVPQAIAYASAVKQDYDSNIDDIFLLNNIAHLALIPLTGAAAFYGATSASTDVILGLTLGASGTYIAAERFGASSDQLIYAGGSTAISCVMRTYRNIRIAYGLRPTLIHYAGGLTRTLPKAYGTRAVENRRLGETVEKARDTLRAAEEILAHANASLMKAKEKTQTSADAAFAAERSLKLAQVRLELLKSGQSPAVSQQTVTVPAPRPAPVTEVQTSELANSPPGASSPAPEMTIRLETTQAPESPEIAAAQKAVFNRELNQLAALDIAEETRGRLIEAEQAYERARTERDAAAKQLAGLEAEAIAQADAQSRYSVPSEWEEREVPEYYVGRISKTIVELQREIATEDTIITGYLADAKAAIASAEDVVAVTGRQALASLDAAGNEIVLAVDNVKASVAKSLVENRVDGGAFASAVQAAYRGSIRDIAETPERTPDTGISYSEKASKEKYKETNERVAALTDQLRQETRIVRDIARQIEALPSPADLEGCALDVADEGLTLTVSRTGPIPVPADGGQLTDPTSVEFTISGGRPPYRANWAGVVSPQLGDISINTGGQLKAALKKDLKTGTYELEVLDSSKRSTPIVVKVTVGSGPVSEKPAESQNADVKKILDYLTEKHPDRKITATVSATQEEVTIEFKADAKTFNDLGDAMWAHLVSSDPNNAGLPRPATEEDVQTLVMVMKDIIEAEASNDNKKAPPCKPDPISKERTEKIQEYLVDTIGIKKVDDDGDPATAEKDLEKDGNYGCITKAAIKKYLIDQAALDKDWVDAQSDNILTKVMEALIPVAIVPVDATTRSQDVKDMQAFLHDEGFAEADPDNAGTKKPVPKDGAPIDPATGQAVIDAVTRQAMIDYLTQYRIPNLTDMNDDELVHRMTIFAH